MEPQRRRVKRKRAYNSTHRQAQAERSRTIVVEAAERLLLERGYAATTIAAIASAANVSVETIYKTFGGKPGLVRAIRARALAGRGPVHAEQRSDTMRMRESDPRAIIREWGSLVAEVAPRVAPILLLVRDAAASDPDMATLRASMDADRLKRMTVNARHLHDHGHLRRDVTLQDATDILWAYSSAELYELLVIRRQWPIDRYARFVAAAMTAALLPPARSGE